MTVEASLRDLRADLPRCRGKATRELITNEIHALERRRGEDQDG